MSESKTKGTPRKRPYDVKRKLKRAAQGQKLVQGTFNWGEWDCPDGPTCLVGAYIRKHGIDPKGGHLPYDPAMSAPVCNALGITHGEMWDIIGGFDGSVGYDKKKWGKVGAELAAELL